MDFDWSSPDYSDEGLPTDHSYAVRWPFQRPTQVGGALNDAVIFKIINTGIVSRESKILKYDEIGSSYEIEHNLRNFIKKDNGEIDIDLLLQAAPTVDSLFESIVRPFIRKAPNDAFIGVNLSHKSFYEDVYISFVGPRNFKSQELLNKIFRLIQSGKEAFLEGNLKFDVTIVKFPSGGVSKGKKFQAPKNVSHFFDDKHCVIKIDSDEKDCGYLAITLGKILADGKPTKNKWDNLRRRNSKALKRIAHDLFARAFPMEEVFINRLPEIETYLENYQIIVVQRPQISSTITKLYRGSHKKLKIFIEFTQWHDGTGHFNLITNIAKYYGYKYFCSECWIGFNKLTDHSCDYRCGLCSNDYPCDATNPIECKKCETTFGNVECYNRHSSDGLCYKNMECAKCRFRMDKKTIKDHECDVYKCHNCSMKYSKSPHYCTISKKSLEKLQEEDKITKIIVAYDIESRQEEVSSVKNCYIHQANLLMSKTVCDNCYNHEEECKMTEDCPVCGIEDHCFFEGDDEIDVVHSFLDYILNDLALRAESAKAVVHVYAHNAKSFDARFIFRDLWCRRLTSVKPIMTGSKILKIDIGNVRFLDACSFFQCPLKALPKCFDMKMNFKKGDFPHLYNMRKNYHTVLPFPDLKFFCTDYMKPEAKTELEKWHSGKQGENFDFDQELKQYCKMDVAILLSAIQKFRNLFKLVTGLDPTTRNFTLASIGQEVFRAKILNDDIGIPPVNGYLSKRNGSIEADCWLDWHEKENHINILREQRKGPFFVDGYCEENNTVYEYNGCSWHGCSCIYPDDTITLERSGTKITPAQMKKKVQEREKYFISRGFNFISIWSHVWNQTIKNDVEKNTFVKFRKQHHNSVSRIPKTLIRDSLCGGRTQNFQLFHQCNEDLHEELKYVDFTSLYPWVLKTKIYPTGHPTIYTENFPPVNEIFGLITCRIVPPKCLLYPVLPTKFNGKLLFGLCNTCIHTASKNICSHSSSQRALIGTWTSVEIHEALRQNYEIISIELVHDFPENQRSSALFREYVDMWLKVKQEASGWPSQCQSENSKEKYIEDYYAIEGIRLEPSKIVKNPGLRQIAKLNLNSFWGKMAQRPNMPQTVVITEYSQLIGILLDKRIRILGHNLVSEDTALLSYEFIDPADGRAGATNPIIASFVTSYARLELYGLILKLTVKRQDRLKYCDTDSAIFSHIPGVDEDIPLGTFLGNLTDELEGFRCDFGVFAGPKSYCLNLLNKEDGSTKTVMKVKGLTLSHKASKELTLPRMFQMVENKLNPHSDGISELKIPQLQFRAKKLEQIITTNYFDKIFRVTCDKMILVDGKFLPIGYQL